MPYIVVNKTNAFEPSSSNEYATFTEAEQVAYTILQSNPSAQIVVAKIEKKYTAQVVITAEDPTPVVPE